MRRLADRAGETVLFAVSDGDHGTMTYIDVIESSNAVRFAITIGDRRPLYATAGGRTLLAAGDEDAVSSYLAALRPTRLTATTEIDRQRLAEAIGAARSEGFAQTVDQAAEGVTGTAAAIRDAAGKVLGALIVAAPSARSHDRLAELAALVREEAGAISRELGFR